MPHKERRPERQSNRTGWDFWGTKSSSSITRRRRLRGEILTRVDNEASSSSSAQKRLDGNHEIIEGRRLVDLSTRHFKQTTASRFASLKRWN